MHSSRMHATHSSSHQPGGCLPQCMLGYPPGYEPGDPPNCGPGAHLGVGLETPQVWAWRPPQVWAWRSPQCGPGDHPPGMGLENPTPARPLKLPLGFGPGNLQDMLGYTPLETCKVCWDATCKACWDTTPPPPPPWTDNLRLWAVIIFQYFIFSIQ